MFTASFFLPLPAHAGLFSNILHFLSGGETLTPALAASVLPPLLGSQNAVPFGGRVGDTPEESGQKEFLVSQDNAFVAPRNPLGTFLEDTHDQIFVYTVQPGDSPGSIAKRFGVSLNTILWANDLRNPNFIKAGDDLIILPVSGVKYEVKQGDTLESIAKRFRPKDESDVASVVADIVRFNGFAVNQILEIGSVLIVPDGEIVTSASPIPARGATGGSRLAGFPELKGYFLRPIIGGRRSRGIHGYNGVDLASSCGFPVLASAEGTVIVAKPSGWNGGYGQYVVITHPEGPQTLYAHLKALFVTVGQKVTQGTHIGDIGSTGNSTGCHVHFEIRGAKNPF